MVGTPTLANHATSTQRCNQLNAGLIMPTTQSDMVAIKDTFNMFYSAGTGYSRPGWATDPSYWIGLNTLDGSASTDRTKWVWTRTRTTPVPSIWATGQPDAWDGESCAHVHDLLNFLWNDIHCATSGYASQACELGKHNACGRFGFAVRLQVSFTCTWVGCHLMLTTAQENLIPDCKQLCYNQTNPNADAAPLPLPICSDHGHHAALQPYLECLPVAQRLLHVVAKCSL